MRKNLPMRLGVTAKQILDLMEEKNVTVQEAYEVLNEVSHLITRKCQKTDLKNLRDRRIHHDKSIDTEYLKEKAKQSVLVSFGVVSPKSIDD